MRMRERNKRLFRNTTVIGIGTIVSKATQYIILSLCTFLMSTSEYGIADTCITTASLLVPLVTIDISQSAFRFAKESNKKGLVTFASLISIVGPFICFLVLPISSLFPKIGEYWLYISLLVVFESIYNFLKEFTRGNEYSKLYVFGGVANALSQIISFLILVFVCRLGIVGYILALCIGYAIEIVFLFFALHIYGSFDLKSIHKEDVKEYVKFSLPLMPNTLMWWIISISDRYFILYMIDESATGLYSVAAKIPALITIITTLFFKAWEMNAISEKDSVDKDKYTSNMFGQLSVIVALSIGLLLVLLRPILRIMVSNEFFDGWHYATILIAASGFSACQSFIGTAYTVEKDSIGCLKTTFVTAISNIILNFILIYYMGIIGAAIATLASYIIVFLYRLFDTRKYTKISINWLAFAGSFGVIVLEAILLSLLSEWYYPIAIVSFVLIIIINFKVIKKDIVGIKKFLTGRKKGDANI